MAHLQQQILDLIQSAIVAGATVAGARVFVDRVDPLQPHELPAVLVDEGGDGERVERYTVHGADQRDLSVVINCIVAHGSGAAAQARSLGLAVEKLLQASVPLAALCKLGIQLNASRQQISGDGDRLMAAREQSWTFSAIAASATPDVSL